jgi:hypothetical protein
MTVNGDTVNIAAQGPNHSLLFYWAFNGSGSWHTETVGGDLSAAQGPSLTLDGNTFYIAVVHSFGELNVWYDTIGTGTWHQVVLAQDQDVWGYAPAITADGSNINISAVGQNGDIYFYWGSLATWHEETVADSGNGDSGTSIAVSGNAVTIAANIGQDQLEAYSAVIGTGTWNPQTVAGENTTSSAPSITPDAPDDTLNISALSPGGQLDFYWQIDGTSPWHPETLPGNGIE